MRREQDDLVGLQVEDLDSVIAVFISWAGGPSVVRLLYTPEVALAVETKERRGFLLDEIYFATLWADRGSSLLEVAMTETLTAADRSLRVRLNPAEKVLALRHNVRIPLVDVVSTRVVDRPLDDIVPLQVSMGFAADEAPLAKVATIGPRARTEAGRALLIVYLNRPAIVIDVDPAGTGWSLLVVSVRHPLEVERAVRVGIEGRAGTGRPDRPAGKRRRGSPWSA